MKLILGSNSERRQRLLTDAGFRFNVKLSETDETYPTEIILTHVPEYLAKKKNKALRHLLQDDEVLITADTVVLLNNKIYGKPADESDAMNMLKTLSGKTHQVITGICIASLGKEISFSEMTKVFFKSINEEMINFYIKKYKPFDKAGAYAIQEWIGLCGIEKIEGDFYNVMGLPVSRVTEELNSWGIKNY